VSSVSTVEELSKRRLTPIEVVRATSAIGRERWGTLLILMVIITIISWGHTTAYDSIQQTHWFNSSTGIRWSLAFVTAFLQTWLNGLGWMAISAAVAAAVRRESGNTGTALLRAFSVGGRWLGLALLMMVVVSGGQFVVITLPQAMPLNDMPRWFFMPTPWLLRWSPFLMETWLVNRAVEAVIAFVAFAPLALVLEGAPVGSAMAVSWTRVRRNWLWVCATAVLLWIPHALVKIPFRFPPPNPMTTGTAVVLTIFTRGFILVGMSLAYVNLMLRAQGMAAAPASTPVPESAPDPRPWDPEIRALGDRWPKV
jgi:hypothetical protein